METFTNNVFTLQIYFSTETSTPSTDVLEQLTDISYDLKSI